MTFKLLISAKAKKQVKLIKKFHHKQAMREIFGEIKEEPLIGKPLGDELSGEYSYKMGVYRILYIINWKDKTITIMTAGHRETVYQK